MPIIPRTNPIVLTNGNVGDTSTGDLFIDKVVWVAPTTQDSAAILKNSRGQVVYHQTAPQALAAQSAVEICAPASGLIVDTLDSGTLYIHLR